MNTKRIMIATLLVGGLAIWFLGGEDEPVPPAEPPPRQAPRQHAPAVPSRPPLPESQNEYGIARAPWDQAPYPDHRPQTAPYGPWGEKSYQTDAWAGAGGYQFRPLNERERQRMRAPESAPVQSMPPQIAAPASPYGRWGEGQYRFPPSSPREGKSGRYEAPYQTPAWGPEPGYAEQWDLPPVRQPAPASQPSWDPPARRMLPSLDWSANRTFTAR